MGKCHEELGDLWQAECCYHRAAAEAPNTREPWVALALIHYTQKRWPDSYAAAMRALAIKDRDLVYTCDPAVWGAQPHDLAAIAAWHMGMKEVAAKQTEFLVKRHRILSLIFVRYGLSDEQACREVSRFESLVTKEAIDTLCRAMGHPRNGICGEITHDDGCMSDDGSKNHTGYV